jgi:hypothetical protein
MQQFTEIKIDRNWNYLLLQLAASLVVDCKQSLLRRRGVTVAKIKYAFVTQNSNWLI